MTVSEKKLRSVGTRRIYITIAGSPKKLIPDQLWQKRINALKRIEEKVTVGGKRLIDAKRIDASESYDLVRIDEGSRFDSKDCSFGESVELATRKPSCAINMPASS